MIIGGITLVIAFVLWAGFILTMQRTFMYPSWIIPAIPTSVEPAPPTQVWWREADNARIEAWFIPGKGVSEQSPGPAVVFAHGNAEVIDQWPMVLQPYVDRGISVLLVEFRGYGRSTGKPSQQAITEDFAGFYDQLAARPEVDETRILFHGRSLGGGVVGSLANHRKPCGMILESTFSSTSSIARKFLVPGFMMFDTYDTLGTLKQYDGPVLIYHGQMDDLIPIAHAHRLAQGGQQTMLVVDDYMTHNSGPSSHKGYWDSIDTLLKKAGCLNDENAVAGE